MSAPGHPLVLNERRGNPHITGQSAAGPEPCYTQVQQTNAPQVV